MLEINHITVPSAKIARPLTFALLPDFHNSDTAPALAACRGADAILLPGDLVDRHDRRTNGFDNAVRLLNEAPQIAPVFYAIGNHERKLPALADYWPHVERSRVTVLDDRFVTFGGVVLGGLSSARVGKEEPGLPLQLAEKKPFLRAMAAQPGFRLLMCHHPEYFPQAVLHRDIDLTVAGHAHGGQVRIGAQGLYAPGQGILPKWTSGFYFDGRLLVSRGVTNAAWAPRIHCRCEVILLHLTPENAG